MTTTPAPPHPLRLLSRRPAPPSRRQTLKLLGALGASSLAVPGWLQQAHAAQRLGFDGGIASGSPTADSVVLWTRVTSPPNETTINNPVSVHWELAEDEAFTRIAARGEEAASAVHGHTVHALAQGLKPARWYWYRFTAAGERSAVGRTRTAPAPGDAVASLDFAITSCQRWDHGHFAAWRDVAAQPLDLVFFLGDYIYEYASGASAVRATGSAYVQTLQDFRNRYALYKSDPLLQAAHAHCPWIVIWDDHEVDNDYANEQGQLLQSDFLARRAAAYQAWWEFMPVPHSLRPNGPHARIQGRLDWGRLARLQWVDDRQYRDLQACPRPGRGGSNTVKLRDCPALADPARSLLGAEQEQWLAQGWSLERPWNLLAQQTLMARFSREPVVEASQDGRYWTDGWDGYPHARQRLLSAVAERKLPGAVVLGGDVHAHYVADLKLNFEDEKAAVVATEFCGTSISTNGSAQTAVNAALPHNPHIRYGRADQRGSVIFRLNAERLSADLRAVVEPKSAASSVQSAARFVVEAGRPGALPA